MLRQRHRTEDDDFLRDGERMRVPVMMRDSAPSWMTDAEDHFGRQVRVTDAHSGARGLHRPGFRAFTDGGAEFSERARMAKEAAYDIYDTDLTNAWRGDNPPTGAGSRGPTGSLSAAVERGRVLERQREEPPPNTPRAPRSAEPPDDDDWDDDDDDLDDDDADAIVARTTTHTESGWPSERAYRQARGGQRANSEARAAAPASDHQTMMDKIYAELDSELRDAWRNK